MSPSTSDRRRALARALRAGLILIALVGAASAASDRAHAQSAGLTLAQADSAKEARLRELKALYDKGLISKSVFLDEQRRVLRNESPAPAATTPSATPTPSAAPAPGAGGLRAGNRWEYSVLRSSRSLPTKRVFEIERASDSVIVERIVMEDGRILSAQHQQGAYVDMSSGMQFSPYYFAFRMAPDVGRIRDVKIKNGDPCTYLSNYPQNSYDCEVTAKFEGEEVVSVPAGNFTAYLVRVEVLRNIWGMTTGMRTSTIAYGRFWFAPKAGRFVKAVVHYGSGGSRTEMIELVSTNVVLAQ